MNADGDVMGGSKNVPMLSILEGKWFDRNHVSMRDLFRPLFTIWTQNAEEAFHYEQFTNESAFRAAINFAFGSRQARTIYIGAHGTRKEIRGFHDDGISRARIKNALCEGNGTTKRGVYFGSCSFGNFSNAELILSNCPRVEWIAGYTKNVDWIDSGALDMCFLRHLLFPSPGPGHSLPRTAQQRLYHAARRICDDMRPLVKRLGFQIYVRKPGGGILDVIDYSLS